MTFENMNTMWSHNNDLQQDREQAPEGQLLAASLESMGKVQFRQALKIQRASTVFLKEQAN